MNTFVDIITDLFGSYTPVTYDVLDSSGNVLYSPVASGFAGVDWPWLAGVLLFGLSLYCVFRIIGGIITKC